MVFMPPCMSRLPWPPLRRVAIAAVVTSAACVPPAVHRGSDGVVALVTDRTGVQPSWVAIDSGVRRAMPIPAGPLDIEMATRLAMVRNPHVRATLAEVGIAQAELWQAATFPNPVLDLLYGVPRSGIAVSNVGVGVSFVRALQLPLRRRVAAAELASTEERVADAVLGVMTDVQRAYVDVQHAQQVLELRTTFAAATAASAGAAKALREAGNVPALVLVGEQAMAEQSVADVAEAEGALATARAELGRLMGAGVGDTAWTIPERLPDPGTISWPVGALDSLALAQRLDVAAARDGARAAASALGLDQRFRLLPDGTIGAFLEREPDGRFAGPTGGIPLPLFDRGGAAIARARAQLSQRVAQHDALVVDVHAQVRTQLAQLQSAGRRVQHLRAVVLPLRRRVLDELQRHVNALDASVFALLQAKQAELDAGRLYLDALRDYWLAYAGLERAVGGTLPALGTH
jgi:cobalt-zinc-cadmium efflux system outer membrane protein